MSKSKVTTQNTTNFHGSVNIGAMSSGEGDINIDLLMLRLETAPTSEDFLDALRQFSRELELAKQSGIPEDLATQVKEEIEASQIEVQKNPINGQSLIKRWRLLCTSITKGVSDFTHAPKPFSPVLAQSPHNNSFQFHWYVGVDLPDRNGYFRQVFFNHGQRIAGFEWWLAGEHLIDDRTKRVLVAEGIVLKTFGLLERRVIGGANELTLPNNRMHADAMCDAQLLLQQALGDDLNRVAHHLGFLRETLVQFRRYFQ